MKKIKKIIILVIVLLLVAGGTTAGVFAYQNYQKESMQAEVVYVSGLNWGYSSDEMTSPGYITSDHSQSVYTEGKTVAEVLVKEGDQVKAGDPLLVYDTTEEQLQVEMAKLELQAMEKEIAEVKVEIEELKKITPRPTTPQSSSASSGSSSSATGTTNTETEKKDPTIIQMQVEKMDGDAYNYIDKKAKPYTGKGTPEKPYKFLCTQECYVKGTYLNRLIEKEQVAVFEIWSGNSNTEGTLLSMWTVNGTEMQKVNDDSKWLVATQEKYENEVVIEEEVTPVTPQNPLPQNPLPENDYDSDYTEAELKAEIAEKQEELSELEIEKRSKEIEVDKLEKDMEDATVVANIDGTIKSVQELDSVPAEGEAFIEILGLNGFFVKGEISELMLDKIEIGQQITANSWETGQTYTATIKEISEYPSEGNEGYFGEGNPNVSYYTFFASLDDTTGLNNGDYLDLSIMPVTSQEEMSSIYIEKAYVREENGQSYVLKANEEERLVKQYVQTGKTLYGSAIEIKSGLTEEDRIAFPYGKTAKEGIRVIESEEYY